jgi:hypothetical protein
VAIKSQLTSCCNGHGTVGTFFEKILKKVANCTMPLSSALAEVGMAT